jgi:putative transposase
LIRDDDDYRAHIDYVHYNPVKHGHVRQPLDWRYSSIHRYVADGSLPTDWGAAFMDGQQDVGRE